MHRTINPDNMAPPAGHYSHGVELPAGARTLYIAGQVGAKPDGSMAQGVEAQAEWAWKNVLTVLEEAGMGLGHIVKYTTYVTRAEDVAAARRVRDGVLGESTPASTLVVVPALAFPEWLIEIEAIAARP